jgi:hypothetical protein
MEADELLYLQQGAPNVNRTWRFEPYESTNTRIEAVCIYCISRSRHTSLVSINSWLLSKIPTWPLHRSLTVVHKNSCRQRLYELVNNAKRLPCYWDFFFQSMLVKVAAVEVENRDEVILSQLMKHCEYQSNCDDCPNPTHLFHRFLLSRPRSHKDAVLSTYCHSWYHCIENCRRHRHPDTPLLISESDAAENDQDFIRGLNDTKCDTKLW